MSVHVGRAGVVRSIPTITVGAGSVNRKVTSGFCGVSGVVRQFFGMTDKIQSITLSTILYRGATYSSGSWSSESALTEDQVSTYGSVTIKGDMVKVMAKTGYRIRIYMIFDAVLEDGSTVRLYDLTNAKRSLSVTCSVIATKNSGGGWIAASSLNGVAVFPSGYTYDTTYTATATEFVSTEYSHSITAGASTNPSVVTTSTLSAIVDGTNVSVDLGDKFVGEVVTPVCVTGYSVSCYGMTYSNGNWSSQAISYDQISNWGEFGTTGSIQLYIRSAIQNKGLKVYVTLGVRYSDGTYKTLYDYMKENGLDPSLNSIARQSFLIAEAVHNTKNFAQGFWEDTQVIPDEFESHTYYDQANAVVTRPADNVIFAAGLGGSAYCSISINTMIRLNNIGTGTYSIDYGQSKWLQ